VWSKDKDFSVTFIGRVRQLKVTRYVEVNIAGNWAVTSVAEFTPLGRWLHFMHPTAKSENG